jgi:hypothetical protein
MNTTTANSSGPESNQPHMSVEQRQSAVVDLTDGSIYTVALYMSTHVDRCAWFARKLTGSSSSEAMEDSRGRSVVCLRPLATIRFYEVLYSFTVSYRS